MQGWFDSPLNQLGRQQAGCLARRLSAEIGPGHVLFSSPLQRAAQTARIIADYLNYPLKFDDGLREYNMGPIAGLTFREIKEQFPDRYQAFERNEPLPELPGAESENSFLERVRGCMDRILAQVPDHQTALIISHSGTLNACLKNWLKIDHNNRRPFRNRNLITCAACHSEERSDEESPGCEP